MRPVPITGNAPAGRAGPDDLSANTTIAPMTFMLATEDILDTDNAPSQAQRYPPRHGINPSVRTTKSQHQSSMSASTTFSWPSPSLHSQGDIETPQDLSRPMTPVLVGNTGPESIISSPSSLISSSAASMFASQNSSAISLVHPLQASLGHHQLTDGLATGHIPQFIMPSLSVPRRRPFSDAGKSLGKLKVLVTGQAGIGKSSLIASIAQSCEHIVHMDPTTPSTGNEVAEIYASTRPCPWWRTELDPSLAAKRRRSSTTDEILDRNLCFVDCPTRQKTYSSHPAIHYVESQLLPFLYRPMNDGDLWNLLSGGTEPIVDAVLYMLPHTGPEPTDVEAIKALHGITNVIPLLARADELSNEQASTTKKQIKRSLDDGEVEYFSFAVPGSQRETSDIYAVSSVSESDHDIIDASILMSSEYACPLVSTDLGRLVAHLMSPDGSARLRHSASLKCVRWRRQQDISSSFRSALTRRHLTWSNSLVPATARNPLLLHQSWRPIEMASWADSLRQSLTAERFGELPLQCLVPATPACEMPLARIDQHKRHRKHGKSKRPAAISHHQDPLGLLGLAGQIKCNSRLTLELVSSVGVLGYVTSWLIRPDGQTGLIPKWC